MIEVEEHLARILTSTPRLPSESLAVGEAVGRTLTAPATAVHDVPAFENSAMDGFAVRFDDVAEAGPERPRTLEVVADVPAGSALDPALRPGQAVRIMTGSPVPGDADTIVPFEDTAEGLTEVVPERVTVLAAPRRRGMFVRARADDVATGQVVLAPGTLLGPRQLAAAVAAGVGAVEVARRPRLAIVTTGSELVTGAAALERGQVPDSSGPLLAALAADAGAALLHVGSVQDEDAAVLAVVHDLHARGADVVVLTGGVSAGAYDAVKSALGGTGAMRFDAVRMQPGKPQGFGVIEGGPLLFGLPGNPVSTAVSWEVFVRPALLALQGRTDVNRRRDRATASVAWTSPPGRRQYVPVVLDATQPGGWRVRPASSGHSGSHLAGSLALADGYAVVPAEVDRIEAGAAVDVILVP